MMAKPLGKSGVTRTSRMEKTSRQKRRQVGSAAGWTTYSTAKRIKTPPANVPHMVKQARKNAAATAITLQTDYAALEAGYRKKLYAILAGAYAVSEHLQRNRGEWKTFIKLPFWEGRKGRPRRDKSFNNSLKFVMKFVFQNNRAWKYTRALQLYVDEGLPPEDVAAQLEEDHGIEALLRRAVARNRISKHNVWEKYDLLPEDYDSDEKGGEEDTGDDPEFGSNQRSSRASKQTLILEVEMSDKHLQKVLALSQGDKARITIEHIGTKGRWHRIKGIRLALPKG